MPNLGWRLRRCALSPRRGCSMLRNRIKNVVVGFEDAVAQKVLAQELPDILDRVQLRRIRGQIKQADIVWDPQLAARPVPSGAIEKKNGMTALRHLAADLFKMQIHRLRIGIRQDQSRARIAMRADGAENISPFAALIARCRRAVSAPVRAAAPSK